MQLWTSGKRSDFAKTARVGERGEGVYQIEHGPPDDATDSNKVAEPRALVRQAPCVGRQPHHLLNDL
jgi:hypothetical protein